MSKYRLIVYLVCYIIGFIHGHKRKKDEFYERLMELESDRDFQFWKAERNKDE